MSEIRSNSCKNCYNQVLEIPVLVLEESRVRDYRVAIERKKEGKYYCVTQTCQKVRPGSVAESLRRRLSTQNPQGRVQRVPRKGRWQFCVPGVLCKVRSSVALVARLRDSYFAAKDSDLNNHKPSFFQRAAIFSAAVSQFI